MRPRPSLVVVVLVTSLLVYSGVAITPHWWPSAVVAPLVAGLLWRRQPARAFQRVRVLLRAAARGAITHVLGPAPLRRSRPSG